MKYTEKAFYIQIRMVCVVGLTKKRSNTRWKINWFIRQEIEMTILDSIY